MEELVTTLNADQLSGLLTGGILGVILGGLATIGFIIWCATSILNIVGCWKIYNKLGEPGWKCLIPFYNSWVQYKYTWNPKMAIPAWVLPLCGNLIMQFVEEGSVPALLSSVLSLAGWIITVIGYHKLSKAFGKGAGFTVGMVVMPSIFMAILGLGKSQYIGNTSNTGTTVE